MSSKYPDTTPKLNTHEAADYLRLSASTLNKMRLNGNGPEFIKLGARRVIYDLRDLDHWLASRRRKSTSQYVGCDFDRSNPEGTR